MSELALTLIGALLVNNFVLAQFLGLCPFMGVTKSLSTALSMGLATTFVLTLSATVCFFVYHTLLVPLGLTWLNIIVFIVVIAGVVQYTEMYVRATSPLLHQSLGIYLPLITTNCAVLGVALLAVGERPVSCRHRRLQRRSGGGILLGDGAVRCHPRAPGRVPTCPPRSRARPSPLITAGIMSLGFLGFVGLDS